GREDARVPAVFLGGLEVEATGLVAGEVHLHHVVDGGVAERQAGRGAEIPVRIGDAHADVAARARREPALAGPVADVHEVLLQVEKVHASTSIRNHSAFSTAITSRSQPLPSNRERRFKSFPWKRGASRVGPDSWEKPTPSCAGIFT